MPYDDHELTRWSMAREFGWTLAEVDALSMGDYEDYERYKTVLDAIQKGQRYLHTVNRG